MIQSLSSTDYGIHNWSQHSLHPQEANDAAIEWIFLVDSLNFSFWTPKDQPQFCVNHKGKQFTGYWALCAAIDRGIERGIPLTDPAFYSKIDEETLRDLFRGADGVEIPLLKERKEILQENGRILLQEFDGKFKNCIIHSNSSARSLLKLIVDKFPSFRDHCYFKGHQVSFYKRAQILIADIWACFKGQGIGHFEQIHSLTMFADYRVPQVLEYFGVLKYSQELKNVLNCDHFIHHGSEFEVEIRGQSIYAVDLLVETMRKLSARENGNGSSDSTHKSVLINSILIDFYLWDFRRQNVELIDSNTSSYHKTRCIYY